MTVVEFVQLLRRSHPEIEVKEISASCNDPELKGMAWGTSVETHYLESPIRSVKVGRKAGQDFAVIVVGEAVDLGRVVEKTLLMGPVDFNVWHLLMSAGLYDPPCMGA
ncbi:MAG TPA: hypothetical protein DEB69_01405 [Candidatus Komeilibacteria bacterium]|nr:MAG: hypothetical protein UW98_C0001G0024 [Parcubacteria group bacterium GW2011_GWC2_45_15]OGY96149.1 MAG: hypothetical protein A3J95_03615 [Candidatus Komeilibacteria bacterium RIFOXYC2_FULL_45_12]HBV02059.1 hypothetical protein [Candidatus Komeilibacteria bacterium]